MGVPEGLAIGGALLGAFGQYQAGEEEAAAAEYSAKVEEREAQAQERRTVVETRRQAEEASRKAAELTNIFGGKTDVIPIIREQARQSELEQRMIGYEGMTETERLREQAKQTRYAGKVARRARRIGAGTSLLTGFSEVF